MEGPCAASIRSGAAGAEALPAGGQRRGNAAGTSRGDTTAWARSSHASAKPQAFAVPVLVVPGVTQLRRNGTAAPPERCVKSMQVGLGPCGILRDEGRGVPPGRPPRQNSSEVATMSTSACAPPANTPFHRNGLKQASELRHSSVGGGGAGLLLSRGGGGGEGVLDPKLGVPKMA